ncbi:hypothetical protein ABFV51_25925 [Pseudomonas asgharzadehiana]|jgi:hypothetical protein|uniref:Uncharacterized protein n=1 Tax=Pseudomonas asgharzadehiana TaxID=2842349 RepID=A0ABX8P342_9PSED|nr:MULTISPECIES: hypothetical protein [Pseudomonas]MCX9152010.1 hypothetical protein [Pseudomonas sp. TB1-B1]QXH68157.1 hypothetical protein KSS96_04260 [Pseudomonas asgharzadehiana]CRM24650.1 hypothetical protein [Pseudomonas sp. 31 E 5]CRM37013.1 hypothetical protein [Pseudomonas sp. 31 E 6]
MFKPTRLCLAVAALIGSAVVQADIDVPLGSTQRVTQLFAYPNNCNVICYRPWTLEQTAEHYLNQSVQRDGYSRAKVSVKVHDGQVKATFSGVPDSYGQPLTKLLDTADLAYQGASKLNSDGKWAYNWYLFLPLGMALENRKSIELLHFPPDYSLTQAQDYLESKTTDRWADLLTTNGVPATETPAYQTIIDIAPIAAPSNAGKDLEGLYSYFTDYQTRMVKELSLGPTGSLPMVAFGAPVRSWVKQQYGQTVGVLGLAQISPEDGKSVSVLGANHPSYIWYAADPATYDGNEQKADEAGLKVMGQDLSAACWQAGMGQKPASDPNVLLKACINTWQVTRKEQTCELFYTSVRDLSPEQANAKCATPTIKNQLKQLKNAAPTPAITAPAL